MPIAVNTIREQPHYRRDAFTAGLEALGYKMETIAKKPRSREDLLILWNLHGSNETLRRDWESNGGTVLVTENGYAGKDANGIQLYAISVHGHNGSGWFPVGGEDRFAELRIEVNPWVDRPEGYVLICGQRGIGSRLMASPPKFDEKTVKALEAIGVKSIKIRQHPGNKAPPTTLYEDLSGARLCVIWSSAAGVKALCLGIPVLYCAPHWICADGAARFKGEPGKELRDDGARMRALHTMAHGQWTIAEIASGEPFKRILARLDEAKW